MRRPLSFLYSSALRGFLFAAFCLASLCCPSPSPAGGSSPDAFPVGLRTFGVWEPDTGERFDFSVWYPSRVPSSENILEGWVVRAGKRGRIVQGFFPVVLLSHDTAGGRFAHNDIASALAAAGMIVIAPTHSGDNQNSSSGLYKAETLRARPLNMLRALETVLDSPDFAPHADESRIGVLGVGAGAITALQLAGAEPDFSGIEEHCRNAPATDAYCAPWGEKRLARIGADMDALRRKQGPRAFSPPLDLFAPELMSVPIPPELLEQHVEARETESKGGLWRRLFGSDEEEDASADAENASAPQQDEELPDPAPAPAADREALEENPAPEAANAPRKQERTGGAASGTPAARAGEKAAQPQKKEPELLPKKVDGALVFCRPATVRAIRGIALVAPAGGMFFSRDSLASIKVPVAVLVAENDNLYPPEFHAAPYVSRLPLLPLRLELPDVDHFSLFAECSRETLNTLSAICGRLRDDDREALAEERDVFLASFFQSVLGGALPLPPPSGLVAVAPPEEPAQ